MRSKQKLNLINSNRNSDNAASVCNYLTTSNDFGERKLWENCVFEEKKTRLNILRFS